MFISFQTKFDSVIGHGTPLLGGSPLNDPFRDTSSFLLATMLSWSPLLSVSRGGEETAQKTVEDVLQTI